MLVSSQMFIYQIEYGDIMFRFLQRRFSGVVLEVGVCPAVEEEVDDVIVAGLDAQVKAGEAATVLKVDQVGPAGGEERLDDGQVPVLAGQVERCLRKQMI